jgi:hypothetical protein
LNWPDHPNKYSGIPEMPVLIAKIEPAGAGNFCVSFTSREQEVTNNVFKSPPPKLITLLVNNDIYGSLAVPQSWLSN